MTHVGGVVALALVAVAGARAAARDNHNIVNLQLKRPLLGVSSQANRQCSCACNS